MRVVLHGQQAFGQAVLERLLQRGENVVAVCCAPTKEGKPEDALASYARKQGLVVHQPSSWKTAEALKLMESFEADICILCGGCVDVCPSYCLSMKTLDNVDGGEDLKILSEMEFGDQAVAQEDASVMLFDPLKCIRCGMCAQKCPTGACKMSVNEFEDCYTETN